MSVTRNGWSTGPLSTTTISVPGCADTGQVRSGPVAVIFRHLAREFDAHVEPLTAINGYRSKEFNKQVGGDPYSNHMSGTALDLNGDKHPYEAKLPASQKYGAYNHGFTYKQIVAIRKILAKYEGVVRWGLDFSVGYRDAMHFEIRGSAADVARIAAKVQEDDVQISDPIRYTNPKTGDKYSADEAWAVAANYAVYGWEIDREIRASLAAVRSLLDQIVEATGTQVDYARIEKAVQDAVAEGVDIDVTVTRR